MKIAIQKDNVTYDNDDHTVFCVGDEYGRYKVELIGEGESRQMAICNMLENIEILKIHLEKAEEYLKKKKIWANLKTDK